MKILAKIHKRGSASDLQELDLFDTDRNPLEFPAVASSSGALKLVKAMATPKNPKATYGSTYEMNQITAATWSSNMAWVAVPDFGDVDADNLARIKDPAAYIVDVGVTYHVNLPVPGDYFFEGGASLVGPNQTIGIGSVSQQITAPPDVTHEAPGQADLVVAVQQIMVIGGQWYSNGSPDLTVPAKLHINFFGNWSDDMRPQFQAGDGANLLTHDSSSRWTIAKLADI